MSKLLINPDLKSMRLHNITPSSAGWKYVGLEVIKLLKEISSLEMVTHERSALCY